MTSAEINLLITIAIVVSLFACLFRQDIRMTLVIFALGGAAGFAGQLCLGRELNRYTPNISLYVWYVSAAVIFAWGTGLSTIWAFHMWLCRVFRFKPNLLAHIFACIPVILVLEAIGSNLIEMKLHDYRRFQSLAPFMNAMHAPVWLYLYYLFISVAFHYMLERLRMNSFEWMQQVTARIPEYQFRRGAGTEISSARGVRFSSAALANVAERGEE
jgi:hypothetical protein